MERLGLLMNYTIFHIGVYMSLISAIAALLGLFPTRAHVMQTQLLIALGLFLFAGICGGIIASHIPYAKDFETFANTEYVGVWGFRFIPAWLCMTLEHAFFWAGVIVALFGFSKVLWPPKVA